MGKCSRCQHVAIALLCLALTACSTHLWVYKLPADYAPLPAGTFPYSLAKAKLTTTFSATLTDCGRAGDTRPSIRLNVTAVTTELIEPDPSERYYVDYTQLKTAWKTTNFVVNSGDNQTLQGINTESNDQTLQVAGAFLTSTAQIAGAALGAAVPVTRLAASPTATPSRSVGTFLSDIKVDKGERDAGQVETRLQVPPVIQGGCGQKAYAALKEVRTLTQTLTDKSGRSGTGVAHPASDTQADPQVTAAANQLIQKAKPLMATFVVQPSPNLAAFSPATDGSGEDVLAARVVLLAILDSDLGKGWVDSKDPGDVDVFYNDSNVPVRGSDPLLTEYRVAHWSRMGSDADDQRDPHSVGAGEQDSNGRLKFDGLIVRQPAVGRMKICVKECAGAPRAIDGLMLTSTGMLEQTVQSETPITFPQFGKRLRLPLDNSIGEDTTLKLSVGNDGSLGMLSFVNNSTAAAGLQSVGGAGAAAGGAVTARDTAIANHNTALTSGATLATSNASLANSKVQFADGVLKAQADCLTQLSAIVKAGGVPTVDCQ